MDVGLGPLGSPASTAGGSLNPCFSGCWSRTRGRSERGGVTAENVLILVLVDVGLGPSATSRRSVTTSVLILVLVDVGLGRH